MVYEICTYHVKENRQDEFEVLARELREYYRARGEVQEVNYIRQAKTALQGTVVYVLYLVRNGEHGPDLLDAVHEKYERRFSRCIAGNPCTIVGEAVR